MSNVERENSIPGKNCKGPKLGSHYAPGTHSPLQLKHKQQFQKAVWEETEVKIVGTENRQHKE
ncbi:hypothetical protein HispidOSU_016491, partial [Sigmodon hispidus]